MVPGFVEVGGKTGVCNLARDSCMATVVGENKVGTGNRVVVMGEIGYMGRVGSMHWAQWLDLLSGYSVVGWKWMWMGWKR
jgi:hypothetical protein